MMPRKKKKRNINICNSCDINNNFSNINCTICNNRHV